MIKNIIKYTLLIFSIIVIVFFISFATKAFMNIYDKYKDKNNKIKFLEGTHTNQNTPLFCFQSAMELASNTDAELPEIPPLGTIPNTNKKISKNNIINFDKFGFRNKKFVWEEKKHNYLVLGDSVVMDRTIEDNFLFSNNFNKSKTINLGCGGNGLLTSLYLLEQILAADYKFNNVLFFINLKNDFSKDTLREYNTVYFKNYLFTNNVKKNIFLDANYKEEYLSFIENSFIKDVENFSILSIIKNEFTFNNIINEFDSLVKKKERVPNKIITLNDGSEIDQSLLPEGYYGEEMYEIFLKILEKIVSLKQKYNTNLTMLIVPTNSEIELYNKTDKNPQDWQKFMNYRFYKNTIASLIASYNISIIDLYDFVKKNDYNIFVNGHFIKDGHKKLSYFIKSSIKNKNDKKLQKLVFYNSFFPSLLYSRHYAVNFNKKLNISQTEDWINILTNFIQQDLLDNYLLSPSMGYFFINNDCASILKLNKNSKGLLKNYSVGELFFEVCSLSETQNITRSIEKIENLLKSDTHIYLPVITTELNKKIQEIYEIQ